MTWKNKSFLADDLLLPVTLSIRYVCSALTCFLFVFLQWVRRYKARDFFYVDIVCFVEDAISLKLLNFAEKNGNEDMK